MVSVCGSSTQPVKTSKWTLGMCCIMNMGGSSRWFTLISSNCKAVTTLLTVPITLAGYLLFVIFCSPSTSSGVITVFLRSSSSVLTGIPMSDELQPCCTFMSGWRGLFGARPGHGLRLFFCSRRRRRRSRFTCVAAFSCAPANTPHSKQALRCSKNNSFSVPPPLLAPVKDKNQPLSSLPSRAQGSSAPSQAI